MVVTDHFRSNWCSRTRSAPGRRAAPPLPAAPARMQARDAPFGRVISSRRSRCRSMSTGLPPSSPAGLLAFRSSSYGTAGRRRQSAPFAARLGVCRASCMAASRAGDPQDERAMLGSATLVASMLPGEGRRSPRDCSTGSPAWSGCPTTRSRSGRLRARCRSARHRERKTAAGSLPAASQRCRSPAFALRLQLPS